MAGPASLPRVLWVTDFDYPARGRDYGAEDRWLVEQLRHRFSITTCDPRRAPLAMGDEDLVVVRNSGPVAGYADAYAAFRARAVASGTATYNELTGRADMLGKQYLVDMHADGLPVIASVLPGSFEQLPSADGYVVKPIDGADSHGLRIVDAAQARAIDDPGLLLQPRIDMRAELSFVFVDDEYHHALTTTPGRARWELVVHDATRAELAFARRFIDWNGMRHGIQRVDACRTADGSLLLVELEDLNPYLSLDVLDVATRTSFVASFAAALERRIAAAGQSSAPSGTSSPTSS